MSAPAGEDLVGQIRQLYAAARQADQPPPGRPTLAKLTGATDYRIRVALAEIANTDGHPGSGSATAGDSRDGGGQQAGDQPPTPVVVDTTAATAPERADALVSGRRPDAGDSPDDSRPPAPTAPPTAPPPVRAAAGARVVSWTGFVFGSVMSVAANVLHTWLPAERMPPGWSPGIAAQIGAAVWPIGLLLSVEVLSRVPWRHGWQWALARYGGTGTVAMGSAVISYGHVHDVLAAWGYGPVAAHVGPLVLDGLMVISGFALLAMSQAPAADPGETAADR